MKKIFPLFLFFLFSYSIAGYSVKSSKLNTIEEAIIGVPGINSKNFYEIKTAISNINGVTLVGYCEQSKCFLINYDPKRVESADQIARTIEALNPKYKTEIKVGTSINQIINSCTKYTIDPLNQPK